MIKYTPTNVCGTIRNYINDPKQAKALRILTKQATLTDEQVEAMEELGIKMIKT